MEDLAPPGDSATLTIKPPADEASAALQDGSKLQDRIKKRLATPGGNQRPADATLGSPTGSGPSARPAPPSPLFSAPMAPPLSGMPTNAEPAEDADADSTNSATAAGPSSAPPLADPAPPSPAVEAEEEEGQRLDPASPAPALSALTTPPAPGPAESPAQTERGGDGSESGGEGPGGTGGSPVETPKPSPTTARRAAQGQAMRKGWLLKKSATKKEWAKAPHSNRYFVSRGHAVSYFDRKAESGSETLGLRGVINMREVLQLRCPSADVTAPALAFDIVLKARTYTLVPQPATAVERDAWLDLWRKVVPEAALREPVVASTSSAPDAAPESESTRRSRASVVDSVSRSLSRVSSVFGPRSSSGKRDSAVAAATAAAAAAAAEVAQGDGGSSSVGEGGETAGAGGGATDVDDGTSAGV